MDTPAELRDANRPYACEHCRRRCDANTVLTKCAIEHCEMLLCPDEDCGGQCALCQAGPLCSLHLNEIEVAGMKGRQKVCLDCEAVEQAEAAAEEGLLAA